MVVEDAAPVIGAALALPTDASLRAALACDLVTVVQIVKRMKNGLAVRKFHGFTVRKYFVHAWS